MLENESADPTTPSINTASEIVAILEHSSRSKFTIDFRDRHKPVAIRWQVASDHGDLTFVLPVRPRAVFDAMVKQHNLAEANDEEMLDQAETVAWSALKDWTAAQMGLVRSGMVTIEEEFLPYLLTSNGSTIYQEMRAHQFSMQSWNVMENDETG